MYRPWRWRDEHTNRLTYYDGTPVTAPFNSEVLEDILRRIRQAFPVLAGRGRVLLCTLPGWITLVTRKSSRSNAVSLNLP